MSVIYKVVYSDQKKSEYSGLSLRDAYLDSLEGLLNDLTGDLTNEELLSWLNDPSINRYEANCSEVIKFSDGTLGIGTFVDSDDIELFPISRETFVSTINRWNELRKKGTKRIVLVRDGNHVWLEDYKQFKRNYPMPSEKPIGFNIDYLFEGYFVNNDMLLAGIFRLSQEMLTTYPEVFSVIKNIDDRYGIVQMKTASGTIERCMFLWAWSYQEILEECIALIRKYDQEFYPHRQYQQAEFLAPNKEGYLIKMVLDYDSNEIIAAYPARSNFY